MTPEQEQRLQAAIRALNAVINEITSDDGCLMLRIPLSGTGAITGYSYSEAYHYATIEE